MHRVEIRKNAVERARTLFGIGLGVDLVHLSLTMRQLGRDAALVRSGAHPSQAASNASRSVWICLSISCLVIS